MPVTITTISFVHIIITSVNFFLLIVTVTVLVVVVLLCFANCCRRTSSPSHYDIITPFLVCLLATTDVPEYFFFCSFDQTWLDPYRYNHWLSHGGSGKWTWHVILLLLCPSLRASATISHSILFVLKHSYYRSITWCYYCWYCGILLVVFIVAVTLLLLLFICCCCW